MAEGENQIPQQVSVMNGTKVAEMASTIQERNNFQDLVDRTKAHLKANQQLRQELTTASNFGKSAEVKPNKP